MENGLIEACFGWVVNGSWVFEDGFRRAPSSSTKMTNSHRRYNHLWTLEVDEVVFEEESKVTNQVVQFYKKLYKESEGWRPFEEGLEFDPVRDMERVWLERKFEREEILQVVSDLEGNKAPDPNGFSFIIIVGD